MRRWAAVKKTLGRVLGVIGGSAVLVGAFGSGSAVAVNEYVGKTYEGVVNEISTWGTAVIRTREGSYLPTEKCMVIGSKISGKNVILDLNCNDVSALNGHPGYSVATPQGQKAKALHDWANQINKDFAAATAAGTESWCAQKPESCQKACERAGNCSVEVKDFLGI